MKNSGRGNAFLAKRRFRACLVTAVLVAVTWPIRATADPPGHSQDDAQSNGRGTDWPRFLGPAGNSKSPETGILTKWRPSGPPVVWHRKLGTSYGIGSVAGGRFFQFDRCEDQARLTCLDARTGKFLWKSEYPTDYEDRLGYNNGPRCSPVIDEDRVYLYGAEGMLYCVRTQDGKPLWKVDTVKKFGVVQNFFGVGSTPVVNGDLLLVMVGGSPAGSQGAGRFEMGRVQGNGTGIVAFDKRTGEVKYAIADELASYSTPQLSRMGGRPWCFVFARGGLVAFDPRTGKVDFHYPWRARLHDSVNASTPVVVGDEVFISEAYGPGSSLLRCQAGRLRGRVVRPAGPRTRRCSATGTRRFITGIPVRFQRPVFRLRRASLHRVENGQGNVEPARDGIGLAALCGRVFCLPQRGRRAAVGQGHGETVCRGCQGRRAGETRGTASAETSGLGGADPFARPALRARGGSAGLLAADP